MIVLRLFLLVQPDVHDQAVGQQFHTQHLQLNGQSVDGIVLFASVQVLQTGGDTFVGLIDIVEVLHLAVAVGLEGVVKELGP